MANLRTLDTRRGTAAALIVLLVVGFGLRVWNIDWDQGQHQHPDERYWSFVTDDISAPGSVGEYFDSSASPLNPYNSRDTWVYGTLPLFLTKATASWLADDGPVASTITKGLDGLGVDLRADGEPRFDDGFESQLVGRLLSALFDTATIGIVFLLGRELAGRRVGLLAALLQTFTVLHIQYSHFYGAETIATFFATVVVLGALRLTRGGGWRTVAVTGLALGLAAASKLNAAAIAIAPAVALLVAHRAGLRSLIDRDRVSDHRARLRRGAAHAGALAAIAAVTFRIVHPYAFDGLVGLDSRFRADLDYLQGVNDGSANVAWTIQWIGRPRLWFPLTSAFKWGLGPGLGVAVAIGVVVAAVAVGRKRVGWLVPLSVVAVYLALVSLQFNALIRYLLPAYPTAVVIGAAGVAWLWSQAMTIAARPTWRMVTGSVALGAVIVTVGWGLAFTNGVYGRDHPRVTASEWLIESLPEGASVSRQVWDDALPLRLPGTDRPDLVGVELDPFRIDSPAKIRELVDALDRTDYVIEASNRLYDAVVRFPARYPRTVAYYDALFDGSLGFEQVAEFRSSPSLLGLDIDDRGAEETFTVYDHPTVTVWVRGDGWSRANALALLDPDRAAVALDTTHAEAGANALQLRPDEYADQQAGGTFDDTFDENGWASSAPWLWWLLWIQLAAFATLPWLTILFARLSDVGYGLSKLAGLVAVALPTWLTVAWGLTDMSRTLAWIWWAAVLALGGVVGWRRRGALARLWAHHRRTWLAVEAVFLATFGVVLAMRFANPDLWHPFTGGEKPMELAYLTAVSRSTTLPPFDPWFAGGFLNYYYLGWFFLSVPLRALRIVPEVGFNLGLPTFAALTAAATFTVAHTLVTQLRRSVRPGRRVRPGLAAAGGVLLLLGIGNLDAFKLQTERLRAVGAWDVGAGPIGWLFGVAGGLWEWVSGGTLPRYDWWAPSRVNDGTFDITEFPFWSLLFGDLHPHVMGLPFFVAAVAVAVAYVLGAADPRRATVLAATVGLLTGLVRMVHTWDLPAVVLLTVAALAYGQLRQPDRSRRLAWLAADLALAGAVHLALVVPYLRNNQAFDIGVEPAPVTTRLVDFFSQFGLFVVIAVAYLALRGVRLARAGHLRAGRVLALEVAAAVTAGVVFGLAFSAVAGACAALFVVFAVLARRDEHVAYSVVAGLFGLAFATAGGVDVVTITNDIQRLNTVFRFWYQSWVLFALASGFALWHLLDIGHRWRRPLVRAGLGALVVATLTFPLVAPWPRFDDRFTITGPTLDGLAYLDGDPTWSTADQTTALAEDLSIVDWLRANVVGSPTIVEAVGPSYQWAGRMSVLTGLPAVVGWEFHQVQQRRDYTGAVLERRTAVEAFYSVADPDRARRFLRTYDVSYVIVGTQEHVFGTDAGLANIDGLPELTAVFRTGDRAVYRVDKAALALAYSDELS